MHYPDRLALVRDRELADLIGDLRAAADILSPTVTPVRGRRLLLGEVLDVFAAVQVAATYLQRLRDARGGRL